MVNYTALSATSSGMPQEGHKRLIATTQCSEKDDK
jgi:hypothetical protein